MATRLNQLEKAMDMLRDQVMALDTKRAHLLEVLDTLKAQQAAKPARKPKTRIPQPPKPGELRERAILGGEPSR